MSTKASLSAREHRESNPPTDYNRNGYSDLTNKCVVRKGRRVCRNNSIGFILAGVEEAAEASLPS
ncbi:MAG: hypothetical protein QXF52_06555 [Thermoproteota archaeon]